MKQKLSGIDVFEVAFAFNPVNKKKFFTVKDGAPKPDTTGDDDKSKTKKDDEPKKDEPKKDDAPAADDGSQDDSSSDDSSSSDGDDSGSDSDDGSSDDSGSDDDQKTSKKDKKDEPKKDDQDPFKTFKDGIVKMGQEVTKLRKEMDSVMQVLQDATMMPATEPDKEASKKDGEEDKSFFPW